MRDFRVGECMEDDFNLDDALPLTQAATALVEGKSRLIGLDYSENARKDCDGKPKKIVYADSFPEGKTVCLNCVQITDNNDGTATLSATKLTGPCTTPTPEMPGTTCPEEQIGMQTKPSLSYPLRIHASFRENDATISNVQVVRIQEQP